LVDSIKYLTSSIKCAVISGYVVLVSCISLSAMAKNFANFFPAQSRLNQSCCRSATKTTETQSVRFTVFDASPFARALERALDGSNPKDRHGIILLGLFPQRFELETEAIADRHNAGLSSFSGEGADAYLRLVDVAPLQAKDFSCSHSGINRADQDCPKVLSPSDASRKQSDFFFERQHANAFPLLGDGDQRLASAERTLRDPSLTLRDIEQSSKQCKFPVDAGETSALAAFGLSAKPLRLVGLEIGVSNRTDGAVFEKRVEGASIATNGVTRAQAGNLSIIDIDRGHGVAVEIPLHHDGEFSVRSVAASSVSSLSFFESFAQPVAGFGLSGTGAPESFALPVLHPSDAGVNVSVADYDLNFMVAGHLLSDKLYERKSDHDGKSNRETDSDIGEQKKQGDLKGIDVLSYLRQDYDEEADLTSDQKVAGSSPAGCIKTSAKSNNQKVRLPLSGFTIRSAIRSPSGSVPLDSHTCEWREVEIESLEREFFS
jgi:hypothetical protein